MAADRSGRPLGNRMPVYFDICKGSTRGGIVEYEYVTADRRTGAFEINSSPGEVTLLKSAPDEVNQAYFSRASYKIQSSWEIGVLPEKACSRYGL
jgi:hypothetical protein